MCVKNYMVQVNFFKLSCLLLTCLLLICLLLSRGQNHFLRPLIEKNISDK